MSTGYQIDHPASTYFLTFTVIDWVDIFTRKIYRDTLISSLDFCRKEKGLQVWGYVIMTNHMHCILSARNENLPDVIRDYKRFTATTILNTIPIIPESRKDWLMKRFEFSAHKNERNSQHQFWTHDNHAEIILSQSFFFQKLKYIHMNPVHAGWVDKPSDWLYSSARNHDGLEGLIEIDVSDY